MKTRWLRVNKKRRCPICRSADWCGVSEDGTAAICMRAESGKKVPKSGWLHRLDDAATAVKPIIKPAKVNLKVDTAATAPAAPERRHLVYSRLLELLDLSEKHRNLLAARGLDPVSSNVNLYRSMPSHDMAICFARLLAEEFDLTGVPGFFCPSGSNWGFTTYNATGYLIPIRDCRWRIVALTLRRDTVEKPKYLLVSSASRPRGASSGAPAHFAIWKSLSRESIKRVEEITVTEGALKADCIAAQIDQPVVGLVGVSCFDETLPGQLRRAFPALRIARIAFDMDRFSNRQVNEQMTRLVRVLGENKIETSVLRWNREFKGYDDFLLNRSAKGAIAA